MVVTVDQRNWLLNNNDEYAEMDRRVRGSRGGDAEAVQRVQELENAYVQSLQVEQPTVDVVTGTQAPLADKQTTVVSDPVLGTNNGMLTGDNSGEPPLVTNTSTEDLFANELGLIPNSETGTLTGGEVTPTDNTIQILPNWKLGDPEPDPSTYRGGATNPQYLADAGAYNASLMTRTNTTTDFDVADGDYGDFTFDFGNMDLSGLDDMFNQDASIPDGAPQYTGGTLGDDFTPDWWPKYDSGVYQGQHVHYADLSDDQKELARDYFDWVSDFTEAGGSFGSGDTLGQPTNPLFFREQVAQSQYDNFIKTLDDLGLTPDDIEGDLYEMARMSTGIDTEEQTDRDTGFELFIRQVNPYVTERNEQERQALYDALRGGDLEAFNSMFADADINLQTNLMYRLYTEGSLSDEDYRKTVAGLHQQENPDYIYFFDDEELFRVDRAKYEEDPAWAYNQTEYIRLFPDSGRYNYEDKADFRGMDWEEQFARNLGVPSTPGSYGPDDDDSGWVRARDNFIIPFGRMALALVTQGASEKLYTAYKIAAGETLKTEDYVNIAGFGLEQLGYISPPTDIIDPTTGLVTGQTAGTGLFGLNYNQTLGAIDALAHESVSGLFTAVVPDTMISGVLQDLGIPTSLATDSDFLQAVRKFNTKLLDGESLEEAGKSAFVKYIKEGGSFGDGIDINGTIFDWSALADLADPLLDTLKEGVTVISDALEPVVDAADDAIDWVGDKIDPALQTVGDWVEDNVTEPVDDVLDATGDVIDDVVDTIADTAEPVVDAVDDVVDYVGDKLEDAKDALPHGETPEVPDGPDLPDVDIDLKYTEGTPAEFNLDPYEFSELFKFRTKPTVTYDEELIAYNDLQGNDPFGRTI